ncbi:hypothetical protein LVY72_05495 [Arthrobacter sp. I2-34]|uniref:Transposase n=1 Tax=Arthrobacter hankyongi TaxID=2904801 RepID=A0ABS9L3Y4_9MICC|nr:hypothetical protein [Arthrobacter hankyongi]MCG2621368.1 hypothetical protein [Arthrobacter hankyongi]
MELEGAARELYSLLPGEFTAARNAKAKASAQEGNKELAGQLKALPKPSAAAWLVNMLALHRRDTVDAVVQLGRELSEAQEQRDPQRLQQLGGQRRGLLAAAAEQARALAQELGHPVGAAVLPEVEQTLHAAMADPQAAAAAASGLLTASLSSNGIDPVDLAGRLAVPGAAGAPASPGPGPGLPTVAGTIRRPAKAAGQTVPRGKDEAARRRRRAEAELDRAEERLGRAEERQQRLQVRLDELADRRGELEDQIAGLKRRITALEREVSGVEQEEAAAEEQFEAAAAATIRAETAARLARNQLQAGS